MPNPTHTDICHSADPQVCAVFEAMNEDPRQYVPETTCADMVKWARALVKAGVLKGGEG